MEYYQESTTIRKAEDFLHLRGEFCDRDTMQSVLGYHDEIENIERDGIVQNINLTANYLGTRRLFHTFYRTSNLEPYRYAGLCTDNFNHNEHPETARKTFIISQYHAETKDGLRFNTAFAKALARDVFTKYGDIPIAPHLYFPGFMVDDGYEREFGIEAGHLFMRLCDSVIVATVDGRVSDGMKQDIDYATTELGLKPTCMEFSRQDAVDFIRKQLGAGAYEERNRPEYR